MSCNEICDKLSLYIDNELSDEEMRQMEEHLKSCENCQKELEEYKDLISILNSLPDEEPPEGYCERLHEKLSDSSVQFQLKTEKSAPKIKKINRFRWLKYGSIAAALVLVFVAGSMNNFRFSGSGAKSKNEAAYDYSDSSAENKSSIEAPREALPEEERYEMGYEGQNVGEIRGQMYDVNDSDSAMITSLKAEREMKIIKTGTISAQTEDYNRFLNDLTVKLGSMGGFLESNNTEVYQVYNDNKLMYGSVKIRIPQESFYELIDYLESSAEVSRKNINETDATKEYYEKDNKVKNLEIQEQHLRELFEKANTVEEMLLIENELRRVRTEIDALNISLSDIDDRAAMSTINLEIEEVMTASLTLKTKDSVWERSKNGFVGTVNGIIRSLENLVVRVVSNSPILIPFVIICIVGFLKIKKYWKKKI